jgi:hypothetical protein
MSLIFHPSFSPAQSFAITTRRRRDGIGIDISPTACRVMAKRLRDVCGLMVKEILDEHIAKKLV